MKRFLLATLSVLIIACQSPAEEPAADDAPREGSWRATIALNDSVEMPFSFEFKRGDSTHQFIIINAGERVEATAIPVGDSLKIVLPVFANYLMVLADEESMQGEYINPDAEDYRLPFKASYGGQSRFAVQEANCCDINKKWRVQFAPGTEDSSRAIAYFEQDSTRVSGSILTETGDYRYLDGNLSGNRLELSTFDGAHLFYFVATIEDGQMMEGRFYSGRSFMEPWRAWRDEDFELADPDSLTYLKEGYEGISFSFPTLEGDTLSLSDERFAGKPVIVQIMGSWCPNCMDESRYLREMYRQYHDDGLEVIGITFERARDRETALQRARKMVDDMELPYPVLLGGATREDRAAEKLPMLNHVMSYPTAIYLDRQHEVQKIHTGFSGPGTPVYESFTTKNDAFIAKLVAQPKEES